MGLFLDPMRDAPSQKVRTERRRWFSPEQFAVSFSQICDERCG